MKNEFVCKSNGWSSYMVCVRDIMQHIVIGFCSWLSFTDWIHNHLGVKYFWYKYIGGV